MRTPEQISKSIDLGDGTLCCNRAAGGICHAHRVIADKIRDEREGCSKPKKSTISNEKLAAGLAELAWGQIVLWNLTGKIEGKLSREEFQKPMQSKFREALGK